MFKKLALIISALAISAGSVFAAAANVVTLDLNRVLEGFHKTLAVKAELEADGKYAEEGQKIKVEEFTQMREKLNKAVADLKATKNNPTLSKSAVAKAEAEVEKLYTDVAKMEQELRKEIQELREILQKKFNEKTNVILKEDILPRIKEIAAARGATIVLNARVGILYADESTDITKDLIARLEKDFPAPKKD